MCCNTYHMNNRINKMTDEEWNEKIKEVCLRNSHTKKLSENV